MPHTPPRQELSPAPRVTGGNTTTMLRRTCHRGRSAKVSSAIHVIVFKITDETPASISQSPLAQVRLRIVARIFPWRMEDLGEPCSQPADPARFFAPRVMRAPASAKKRPEARGHPEPTWHPGRPEAARERAMGRRPQEDQKRLPKPDAKRAALTFFPFFHTIVALRLASYVDQEHLWSSGYDVSLTRSRSPAQSWPGVFCCRSLYGYGGVCVPRAPLARPPSLKASE